ncbi:hypothetical protein SAMN04487911_10952 [Arenibacter nanhaiticus]|uniref:Uncharacterized protein n=1 Tax=Arenibacter nanhaiticus TaxID=558155 RepID=A0A1M6FQY8_9FLAO|nr:hypothetical protein [Arenibacter nanhaiticus]SHJ00076.1 hypothetical protein SAMN04487911_10952 [Arenibacter nanhaiticus]
MTIEDLSLPEFIFGEFPIKNDSIHDQRQFILHKGISLIEVIPQDELENIAFDDKTSKHFSYFGEDFTLFYQTNNTAASSQSEIEVLDRAWEWYREYLIWEDTQEE